MDVLQQKQLKTRLQQKDSEVLPVPIFKDEMFEKLDLQTQTVGALSLKKEKLTIVTKIT